MKKYLSIASWLAGPLVLVIALIWFESDLLWKIQQFNLFLSTPLFFKQMMVTSGGFLTYVASYFTQYFYYPWLGALIYGLWVALLMWLTKRTFRIQDKYNALMFIPAVLVVVANMDLGYWHYMLKLRGYFYAPVIGTSAVLALLWLFRVLPQRFRLPYVVVTAAVGYPLLGAYGLAAVLLMALWSWRLQGSRTSSAVLSGVALLCIAAIPLLFYRYVYYQTALADAWTTALPVFILREPFPLYYIPYGLLLLFLVAMVLCWGISLPERHHGKLRLALNTLGGFAICLTVNFWYSDANFHHELRMQHCIERLDWVGVIKEGTRQQTEPTRSIVIMHNLALSRLGRQVEDMYNFPKGSAPYATPLPIYTYHILGRLMYYNFGLPNECHRICMEDGVEYGWRPELLQYMARCALLNGEYNAARKFLNQLRATTFFGGWANHFQNLIDHPDLIAKVPETAPITHMMHYDNRLGSDQGYVEKFIMNLLAEIDSDDPYFQENAVLAAMWTRDPNLFWPRFAQYGRLNPNKKIPRIIQEAAYLFANMQHLAAVNTVPFRSDVKATYQQFMLQLQQMDGQPIERVRAALYPMFGHTYFYEYYFLKDITYF